MRPQMGEEFAGNGGRAVASMQAAFLLLIIVLMLLSFGCVKAPVEAKMPSWQTQLTLPIVDRTYYFSDLVAKDNKFETLVNGEVVYRPSDMQNTPTAVPLPSVYPVSAMASNKLGPVPLTVPALSPINMTMTSLLGQTPPQVPWASGEVTAAEVQSIISDTASYDYVTYTTARMTITITNTMNFDVIFPSGIQVVNVFSASDTNKVLVTFPIGLLKTGASQTLSADISGSTMSSRLKLKYIIQTFGIQGVVPLATGQLSASMSIDGGTAGSQPTMSSAQMRLTGDYGQVLKNGFMQLVDDSTYIKRADFTSGGFNLVITNNVAIDIATGLVVKELVNKSTGQPLRLKVNGTGAEQDEVVIPRNTRFVQNVNLNEYTFISKNIVGTDTIPTDGVQYTMTMRSTGPTSDKRLVNATDSVTVSIVPRTIGGVVQPMSVSKFSGVIKPTAVAINEAVATDFGTIAKNFSADSIKFDGASIILKLFTKTTYPADINLRVTAYHNGVRGMSMNIPSGNGGLNGSYRIFPGDTSRIIFNKSTTTSGVSIDQFMNSFTANGRIQLPDKLMIEGTGTIEPADLYLNGVNGTLGSVTNGDSLYSAVEFSFPVRIAIQNGIFKDTTVFTNTIEKDKLDLLQSGTVSFQIENTMPVAGDVSLMMMGSKYAPDTLLNLTKSPLHVEGAVYNAAGSNTPSKSYSFITLGQGEPSKFYSATVAAVTAHMKTGNGLSPVSFRATDHIRVKAYGTFNVTVDFNKMSGDNKSTSK
jgi:hypothetical protein